MTPSFYIHRDKLTGLYFDGAGFSVDHTDFAAHYDIRPAIHPQIAGDFEVVAVTDAVVVCGSSETPVRIIGEKVEWLDADYELAGQVNTDQYALFEAEVARDIVAGKIEGVITDSRAGAARGQRWEVRTA